VNAAERLWRGLARHDWEAVRAQFHASAVVELAGAGTRQGVDEFVATRRVAAASGEGDIEVLRSVVDGRVTVIEARVGDRRCACIYDLHDGRIAGGVEYWTPPAPPAR
jgi:ketosteroid isomerase-like protein